MRAALLQILVVSISMTACSPRKTAPKSGTTTFEARSPRHSPPEFKPDTEEVSAGWQPSEVEVLCNADKCPLQVGVLMFAGKADASGRFNIRRCTAFLISADIVMSNGHCDGFGKENGFFVSQRVGGQKQIRTITGVPFKRFTPHSNGETLTSGRPDVAMFKLNHPVTGIPALKLASGPQLNFKKLIAFAIMNSPSKNKLTIEKTECTVRRHEAEFPVEMAEAPDVIQSYDCRLDPGTSGSPMFAPGSDEVQAVQVGGIDPVTRAKTTRDQHKRELFNYEKHFISVSTNVRCLDYPGAKPITCLTLTEGLIAQRFSDATTIEFEKMRASRIAAANAGVQLRASPFQLAPKEDLRFEIVHTPECRRSQESPKAAVFIIEQAKIQYDEWATPSARTLSQINVNTDIKSVSGNLHEMEFSWPAPAGQYLSPDLDYRKRWGNRFHIDLPVCPR